MTALSANTQYVKRSCTRKVLASVLRAGLLIGLCFGIGFFVFTKYITDLPTAAADIPATDGIVALTGGEDRIYAAIRLLSDGKAKRLLISGVYPSTNKPILMSLNGIHKSDERLFQCCVDLDKRALNTEANALETAAWAKKQGFRSIIVVTSNYHMPRALIELRGFMPDVTLVPYAVESPSFNAEWWRDEHSLWVLTKEYLKFTAALVRYAALSLTGGLGEKETTHTHLQTAKAA